MPALPRTQLVAWAIVLALLAAAAAAVLSGGESGGDARPPIRLDAAPGAEPVEAPERRARVYVHVAGEVRRPGLYLMEKGRRVGSALKRAGGTTRAADLTAVNLAAQVRDGQQVIVPSRRPGGGLAPTSNGPGASTSEPPISLSSATAEQLDGLDGIGPTLAERIISFRDEHGGLEVGQLREIEGIGEKRFEALRARLAP